MCCVLYHKATLLSFNVFYRLLKKSSVYMMSKLIWGAILFAVFLGNICISLKSTWNGSCDSRFFPFLMYCISEWNCFSNKKKKCRAGLELVNRELIGSCYCCNVSERFAILTPAKWIFMEALMQWFSTGGSHPKK